MKQSIVILLLRFAAQAGCIALTATGLWYIFGNSVRTMLREEQHYRKLTKTVMAKRTEQNNFLVDHIIKTISTVRPKRTTEFEAYIFISISIALFVISFLISAKIFSMFLSMGIAMLFSVSPYALIRLRLRNVQIDSSYDADTLITTITNEYKQHYYNMIKGIENSAVSNDVGGHSKRILYRLSLSLKDYQSENELDNAINQFVYSYDTKWARMLGINIKMAIYRGLDVSSGLEDILKKLKDTQEQIEASKRYNSETFAMIRFILIPLYFGGVYLAVKTFGFTLKKYLEYQFMTVAGLRMSVLTILSILISFMALLMIRKPKYDI